MPTLESQPPCTPALLACVLAVMLALLPACKRRSSTSPADGAPPTPKARGTVTVFAAASTTDVMQRIGAAYEAAKGVKVQFSFDSSSSLARQIRAGAPADVFLSADEKWMDDLASTGSINSGSRQDLLANRLVIVGTKGRELTIRAERGSALPPPDRLRRFAMGDPEHVPAGRYGRESLDWLGWWAGVEGRLITAQDVRAALRLVEIGEADAGIVYSTDAQGSQRVRVLATLPEESHVPIRYPVALTKSANADAPEFLAFLRSPEAVAVFERAGFTVLPSAPSSEPPQRAMPGGPG